MKIEKISFKRAETKDIEEILEIIKHAKEYLKSQGLNQWQSDYPNFDTIKKDIEKNQGYIAISNDVIIGYLALIFEEEEIYKNIEGAWKSDRKYISIHRTAFHKNSRGKGLGSEMFKFAEKIAFDNQIFSIRIDTDPRNLIMKHLIEKNGYEYCGLVFIEGAKIAFEKLL